MHKRELLDCTLRDGGYLNDWNFGHDNLVSVFERLVSAGIDYIEVGFIDDRRDFDINRSIMPNTESVSKIYGKLKKENTKIVGMIDYGTCRIENIQNKKDSYLDCIRVIFKKHLRKEALQYCKELKQKGYKVFAQLVSVTSYSDEEMFDLINIANDVKPYAVSMVDTYGLLHQNNLTHYFNLLDKYLNKDICLGYHGHNNFQMGYANCITMIEKETERDLLVDGSLYGMGKSAGNAPIELVAMYMNKTLGKNYDISHILEAIDSNISQFYTPATWGYNLFYYLAASNDCHPNYVGYLMDKKTLSISAINEILSSIDNNKKLLYDNEYIKSKYMSFQQRAIEKDDNTLLALKREFENKNILVLGPGNQLDKKRGKVLKFILDLQPIVISINFIPEFFSIDYLFLTNSKRYVQLATKLSHNEYKIIATSNVNSVSYLQFNHVLNYGTLIDKDTEIIDNSLIMMLKFMKKINYKSVYLAGFDGYSIDASNYIDEIMEYDFIKSKHEYLNNYVRDYLINENRRKDIVFLTESKYED